MKGTEKSNTVEIFVKEMKNVWEYSKKLFLKEIQKGLRNLIKTFINKMEKGLSI